MQKKFLEKKMSKYSDDDAIFILYTRITYVIQSHEEKNKYIYIVPYISYDYLLKKIRIRG